MQSTLTSRPRTFVRVVCTTALVWGALQFPASPVTAAPAITFDGSPGTDAPPSHLGPYEMTPFGDDTRPACERPPGAPCPGTYVTDVSDEAGTVTFSPMAQHREVGYGWGNWSHGYSGDVYYVTGSDLTMTLPAGTLAFSFYAQPNSSVKDITATAEGGTSSGPIAVNSASGATYFGFFATDGATLTTITVSLPAVLGPPLPSGRGFAVGEFAIALAPNRPPDCSNVTADVRELRPANHKLHTVTLSGATDPDGDSPTLTVTGVTQDEGVGHGKKGAASPDAVAGPASTQVALRAERDGNGDGRVYRVAFRAADSMGAACTGVVTVGVPHDSSRSAVDSPATYDSFAGNG